MFENILKHLLSQKKMNIMRQRIMNRLKSQGLIWGCCIIWLVGGAGNCKDVTEDCTDEDYANCNTIGFTEGLVEVDLSINQRYKEVRVQLFEGRVDDGVLFFDEVVSDNYFSFLKPVGNTYSGRAFYVSGMDSVVVVDGDDIKNLTYVVCELQCNDLKNAFLDLKIH